jgi:hypothetical protein
MNILSKFWNKCSNGLARVIVAILRKVAVLAVMAGVAQAQVTNTVNISNSLLGPITNVFTNTQISVGEAIITGAVFNASVTNTFSPSITNEISVGAVSVTNNITNDISVTNIIENIAVAVTNTVNITNITQTFVTTSGVSSINSEEGAITFEGSGVTQTGTVFNFSGGGGGGDVTINGVTTNEFTFVGQFPVAISNIANTFYFGQLGGGGTFIPATGTSEVFNFVGSVTQTFTVPSGVTQLYAYAWGAGGGGGSGTSGGAGGYDFGYFSVTTGEVLSVVIGEGGFISSATASTAVFTNTLNPFPNGGWGASRHTGRAGAGGGSTAILRGTNLLVVAGGGGGGAASQSAGGGGGGTSGQDGYSTPTAGGGGTQSAGGAAGSTATALSITNTAGGFYLGGNAGLTTNQAAYASGGGGGGLYGGGGGVNANSLNTVSGGGGGSGYINTSEGVIGTTVQAQTPAANTTAAQPPPATDDPLYGSPTAQTWGRGGAATAAGSNGGMIIRWVQP